MTSIASIARNVDAQAERAAPWLIRFARIGEAAFGVIFAVIGLLAGEAALGIGGRATDPVGALNTIRQSAFGTAALVMMAAGLLAYALWSVVGALLDADRDGARAKGILRRVGHGFRGLAFALLGLDALQQLRRPRAGTGHVEAQWTAYVLRWPAGRVFVAIVAAAIVAYALYWLRWAFGRGVRERLAGAPPTWVTSALVVVGRLGNVVMNALLMLIGTLLLAAAVHRRTGEAAGLDESLARIATSEYGTIALATAAAGLVAYGVFEIASARYRRMPVTELQRST